MMLCCMGHAAAAAAVCHATTGRSAVDFALLCQRSELADLMKQLSVLLFTSAVAACCRRSVYHINGHKAFDAAVHAQASAAAVVALKGSDVQRVRGERSRRRALAWAGLAGVLKHRLSFQLPAHSPAATGDTVFHSCVKKRLVTTCARGAGALQLADVEIARANAQAVN